MEFRMMFYPVGSEIRVGDHVFHSDEVAVVERILEGEEVATWGLEEPGFLLVCKKFGQILIHPGSEDWEDVDFVRRGA